MSNLLDKPTRIRPGEELDVAKLEPYLRAKFPDAGGVLEIRQYPSGHSNLTYAVRLGDAQFVLRRPPFGSKVKSAHDMGREFRVLAKLHAVYPPAPEVLFYCDDDGILGAPFYVMRPIHGVILRENIPPDLNLTPQRVRELCVSLLDNLIRLHHVDYTATGLADLGKPAGYLERQVRGWIDRYHSSKTHEYAAVEKIASWLQENMPATRRVSLIHNDYKFNNVILNPGNLAEIIGVLDWEMATIGDPLTDLGTTLAYWADPADPDELKQNLSEVTVQPGSFSRGEMAALYGEKTGADITQMPFYLSFARFKLAVIVQQIFYRYSQGLTKDPRFAVLPERVAALLEASLHSAQRNQI
jgi:aminoglycoside phosphotransferase (APT) family kinase protein